MFAAANLVRWKIIANTMPLILTGANANATQCLSWYRHFHPSTVRRNASRKAAKTPKFWLADDDDKTRDQKTAPSINANLNRISTPLAHTASILIEMKTALFFNFP